MLPAYSAAQDLTQVSLEDLMNMQVTSVSKKEQTLSKAGAAAYVITQEDIRRSGMSKLPDLLRLAPGVNVAQLTASTWAISIRGFNDRYATKCVVLIDGRSVYSQQFSGVFWDQQAMPLEEIERIEIIRGPGGTVWGANAVNGVINIITKDSRDTHGGQFTAGGGTQDSVRGSMRYGGKLGKKGSYRVFGQLFNVENSVYADGSGAADGWAGAQAGFRTDWDLSPHDSLTVSGETYHTRGGQGLTTVVPQAGYRMLRFDDRLANDTSALLGRWSRSHRGGSETSVQVSMADLHRFDQSVDGQDIFDADVQHRFQVGKRHDLVTGAVFRRSIIEYHGLYSFRYDRTNLASSLIGTFLQDEIQLSRTVAFTLGSKFERNSFTGFEYEPSGQIVWTPNTRKTFWASAARAIRQPSWFNQNAVMESYSFPLEGGGIAVSHLRGSRASKAERLYDFEAGHRAQVSKRLSVDLAIFRSYYRELASTETGMPYFESDASTPHLAIPAYLANLAEGTTYGAEVIANWQVARNWRLTPVYSFLQMNLRADKSNDMTAVPYAGNSPKHQAQARSTLNLRKGMEWDIAAYFVSRLDGILGGVPNRVNAHTRLDSRVAWQLSERGEFSVVGQNLLYSRHAEFSTSYQVNPTQVRRSLFGRLTWRF
jgi:iron complex outermembrane recepter protein